ncbi:hypothetical protein KFU94_32000 [Chloroflexi bacterium TSY]|nr:hypothetical protein [Chloroflexi bacterium TSY]
MEIIPNDEKRIAQVNVKCEVHFTDQEMETMLQNPARTYFTLFCWLMGKDFGKVGPIDTDDWIFSFEAKTFSDDDPTQVEEVLFSADGVVHFRRTIRFTFLQREKMFIFSTLSHAQAENDLI